MLIFNSGEINYDYNGGSIIKWTIKYDVCTFTESIAFGSAVMISAAT